MRGVIFFGHGAFGERCLKCLIEAGLTVLKVYTHPALKDPNTGRLIPDVMRTARAADIPVSAIEPNDISGIAAELERMRPELIASVNWRGIFPRWLLAIPKFGAVNLHGSLLPRYRGNAPTTWAMIDGQTKTGATVHFIDEGMDTGDIILQRSVTILDDDYVGDVLAKQLEIDGPLLVDAVELVLSGSAWRKKQDHALATIGKKRSPQDGKINWSMSATEIYNWIRAQSEPLPGAFFSLRGRQYIVWRSKICPGDSNQGVPGQIATLYQSDSSKARYLPVVGTGSGNLILADIADISNPNENILEDLSRAQALFGIGEKLE